MQVMARACGRDALQKSKRNDLEAWHNERAYATRALAHPKQKCTMLSPFVSRRDESGMNKS